MPEWTKEHPQREGYYWYWHPDFQDPCTMRVVRVRSDTECRWMHDPGRYPCDDEEEWWRGPFAPIDGPEPPTGKSGRTDADVYQDDVLALLEALGLGTHARPSSPHAVLQDEVLPAVRQLRNDVDRLRSALVDAIEAVTSGEERIGMEDFTFRATVGKSEVERWKDELYATDHE